MPKKNEVSSISSSDLSSLLHSPLGADIAKPFSRQLFLTHIKVVGSNHVEGMEKLLKELDVDDRVQLLREPKNEYDEYAIVVKDSKGRKLGYIPRTQNHVFARLMDAGKLLYGIVTDIKEKGEEDYIYRPIVILLKKMVLSR